MNDQGRWSRVEEIFGRVIDLPANEQEAAIEQECAGDPELLAQVRTLLRHDRSAGGRIAEAIDGMASVAPEAEQGFEGRAMGPYRITREIGRGGMGIVFEALRDDGQFEKRVALKVAANAVYSPDFLTRFRNERQILAGLEHPHIARMLDGGTTPEQIPFFAMEYVEGVPIDQYVEANRLSIPECIRLFLQVCEAVEYAHRNLVIHRDLKPGNILVADGFARLLDFGIAKLAYSDDATVTRAGFAPVTPDYCSPEQLKGEAVTARTDVYSLGLVLYKLLTGERGQKADTSSPVALTHSVCEATPVPPSACASAKGDQGLARQLRGDLDTIAMAAIDKDPSRRYLTVEALAGDLRAHLEGQPIQARQHSHWYRTTRFVHRHALGIAAVVAAFVALTAGLVTTISQARRAERRFQQVRKLADTLVKDIGEANRPVPASAKAQEIVMRTAAEYLEALAAEAGSDTKLRTEAAVRYREIAVIAYSAIKPSLERPEEARRYLEKAKSIMDSLFRSHPNHSDIVLETVRTYQEFGEHFVDTSQGAAALELLERAIELGEAALSRRAADRDFERVLIDMTPT